MSSNVREALLGIYEAARGNIYFNRHLRRCLYMPHAIPQLDANGTEEQIEISLCLYKSSSAGSDVVILQRWAPTEIQR